MELLSCNYTLSPKETRTLFAMTSVSPQGTAVSACNYTLSPKETRTLFAMTSMSPQGTAVSA